MAKTQTIALAGYVIFLTRDLKGLKGDHVGEHARLNCAHFFYHNLSFFSLAPPPPPPPPLSPIALCTQPITGSCYIHVHKKKKSYTIIMFDHDVFEFKFQR